jgi:hypothetical protein
MPNLQEEIQAACAPLFDLLPLNEAMPRLIGSRPAHVELVESVLRHPAVAANAYLAPGLWLYVDDLERSHTLSQGLEDETGSYWHGIMHRREGDFGNSHYWMRRCARHPLRLASPDLDPDAFVDQVAAARGADTAELVERQRQEWLALFLWCIDNPQQPGG